MDSGNLPFSHQFWYSNFSAFSIPKNPVHGCGHLTWLSSKAGLITCSKPIPKATISFQLKDFCDQGVTDLTSVLRVGFMLSFSATNADTNPNDWIASYVSPLNDQDIARGYSNDGKELDLEAFEQQQQHVNSRTNKESYSLTKEMNALSFLMSIYLKNGTTSISLSSLHSRISNSGNEDLYRYIGTSSLKRRHFIEERSYLFHIDSDTVFLQPPEVYNTVCLLAGYLLTHGGVTSTDALLAFFNTCSSIPNVMKEYIHNRRQNFMSFLLRHPFAFSPFPSHYYVSVRRNLPYFEYTQFIRKHFASSAFSRSLIASSLGLNTSNGPILRPLLQSAPTYGSGNGFKFTSSVNDNGLPASNGLTATNGLTASNGLTATGSRLYNHHPQQIVPQTPTPYAHSTLNNSPLFQEPGSSSFSTSISSIWAPNDMDFFDNGFFRSLSKER